MTLSSSGLLVFVASVVEWLVRSAAVREDAGLNPTGANVVIPAVVTSLPLLLLIARYTAVYSNQGRLDTT